MEKDKYKYRITETSPLNYSKISKSQKNDLELKRFKSHEVYLVTQKKKEKNENSSKEHKKIYINISKTNQSNIKPKSKKSFNNNSKGTSSENEIFNKSKTKLTINTSNTNNKSNKIIIKNIGNSTRNVQKGFKASKILDEESIQELDSEGENISSIKKEKNKNLNTNSHYEKSDRNLIIKKINFDDIKTNSKMNTNPNISPSNNQDNQKNRELLIISKKGDKEKLLELISSNKININYQNENGWSALHFASNEGSSKIVDILIKSKIDVNLKTNEKKTALHISCFRGYFDISKLLIENGATINVRDNEKNLPIHICASQGHDELINYILEKNKSGIKIKNIYGKTPLDLATKESTKEIIKKFINIKNKSNDKSPKNETNKNNNFSRIKIRKTNKNLMKFLMTPISQNKIFDDDNNDDITKLNNTFKKSTTNKISNVNKENIKNINIINSNNSNNNTLNNESNINKKNINEKEKEKINTSSKKLFTTVKHDFKQNKENKLKIEISSSNKSNYIKKKELSNNNRLNDKDNESKNINTDNNNNNNYPKYLNTSSNKNKTIFNIHISCNNTGNKSPSPLRESNIHCNTSSNMKTSNKKIVRINNNNNNKGNEIFFGDEKGNTKGKIINIPKKIKNKKENSSQNKKNKATSILKTKTQNERIIQKYSPNIKYSEKYIKKNMVFKKEQSKIMNNLSSKRTVSVPKFLDTEYILEKPQNKRQYKREESAKNKFKVPNKNGTKEINNKCGKNVNNSNQDFKNANRESVNSFKGKINNYNNKNMKKQNSNKNKKKLDLDLKTKQIYTDEGAHLIDDLEEETTYDLTKDIEKKNDKIKKNKSKELKKSNRNLPVSKVGIKTINNSINISINIPQNQNLKKSQNITTENDENEDDDIDELEDSFDGSDDNDSNRNEKIGPSDFVCLALLGQGSFGEVYLVKKKDSNDFYAMKVLDKFRIAKQNIFKYVLTERNVLSVMHNPFIVKLNYAFQTSEKLFLLLDFCPGGDLSKQLQIQTRFSEEKAKFYICEIILALGDLHKNNIIFRDLKPDNVVIDKEGHALLTDFGLSRENIVGKEMAKSFCGSIAYLAPEMINRTGHGKAVDWYLLGVLFYELLVGVPPYFTSNQEQIFMNIKNAELYIPSFISNKAANLIKTLLKRNPNERLGSKRDVEEVKEHEYFADVDWQKVYERKYKPPQIYLKSNHLQFFRQPVQFKENEEDDLFVKDNYVEYNKYNQEIVNSMNNYEGWSFIQKGSKGINAN